MWLLFFGTISALGLIAITEAGLFSRLHGNKMDAVAIVLYAVGSAIGAFDERFFNFGKAGNIVCLLMALYFYTFTNVYNSNLRAFMIG